jgi:hypothetical protein
MKDKSANVHGIRYTQRVHFHTGRSVVERSQNRLDTQTELTVHRRHEPLLMVYKECMEQFDGLIELCGTKLLVDSWQLGNIDGIDFMS